MNKYNIGVLGGMGPFATSEFFKRVIQRTVATRDQDHINMMILNHATIPDRTEAIINEESEIFLNTVKNDLSILEKHVDVVAIPCNTSHFFIDEMQNMTSIELLNMVQLTVNKMQANFKRTSKIAVLATSGTIQTKIYEKELNRQQFQYEEVSKVIQQNVMNIIYQFKVDANTEVSTLSELIEDLTKNKGYDGVILACTELSCITIEPHLKPFYVDALDVLVEETILKANKLVKE